MRKFMVYSWNCFLALPSIDTSNLPLVLHIGSKCGFGRWLLVSCLQSAVECCSVSITQSDCSDLLPGAWFASHGCLHTWPGFGRVQIRPHWGGVGRVLIRKSDALTSDREHSLPSHANTDGFLWVWQPYLTLRWSRVGECHNWVSAGQQLTAERQFKKWPATIFHL